MDRFIAEYAGEVDDDLMLCVDDGCAYQIDREFIVEYDSEYFGKCRSYEDQEIAIAINAGRAHLVNKHIGCSKLLDVGIGSGEFVRKRPNTYGTDVNFDAIEWLKERGLLGAIGQISCMSFWDVLEHVETPEDYLRHIPLHGFAFASIPVFDDLTEIRLSRHYRPGEHLYYWTHDGFVEWMRRHGFYLLEDDDFETRAGRESINSYAFKRIRWT